jgi:hypothetical protein
MAVVPFSSSGTIIQVNISGSFATINKIDGFQIQTAGKPSIDSTGLEDSAKTKVTGLPDNGQASGTIHFDPRDTTHAYLFARSQAANTEEMWKIILPFSAAKNIVTFNGSMQNMQLTLEKDATVKAPMTVELSGAITFT